MTPSYTVLYCCWDKGIHLFLLKCRPITIPYFVFVWSCSSFTKGNLPGVWIVLCHQVCLTRDRKKLSTILCSFLFTVRCDKWLVSVPLENNITPAFAVCPIPVSTSASIFYFSFLFFLLLAVSQ